jgi:Tol biopolymer transport system component
VTATSRADEMMPDWSPDGTRIAFTSYGRDGYRQGTYTMAADGSDVHRISTSRHWRETNPAWAPDGQQIIFDTLRYSNRYSMYVADAEGVGDRHRLFAPRVAGSEPSWGVRSKSGG